MPANGSKPELSIRRIAASKFQLTGQVDRNIGGQGETIFTMMLKQTSNHVCFRKKGLNDRPIRANFLHEGSIDDGGPMRECFDFACKELESGSLPILIPTENRKANHGEMRHCYVLNHECGKGQYAKNEMEMLYFFGCLIGYGILSTNPLPLYLHPIFWKQVVGHGELKDEADLFYSDQYSW